MYRLLEELIIKTLGLSPEITFISQIDAGRYPSVAKGQLPGPLSH